MKNTSTEHSSAARLTLTVTYHDPNKPTRYFTYTEFQPAFNHANRLLLSRGVHNVIIDDENTGEELAYAEGGLRELEFTSEVL